MEDDLQMAREVQLAMQPQHHERVVTSALSLQIAHRFLPAGGVSGDFFDVLRISDNAVGVLVCDVMGHGVRSALVTAMIRAMLEALRPLAADPGALLSKLNRDLTRMLRQAGSLIFVTAAYAVVDLQAARLRYAQAGHPTPFRTEGRSGAVRAVRCPAEVEGPALGLLDDFGFVTAEEPIAAGDRILLYTDGVFEAARPDGEEFGQDRLMRALGRHRAAPLDAGLTEVLADISEFCEGVPFADDLCMVAVNVDSSRECDPWEPL